MRYARTVRAALSFLRLFARLTGLTGRFPSNACPGGPSLRRRASPLAAAARHDQAAPTAAGYRSFPAALQAPVLPGPDSFCRSAGLSVGRPHAVPPEYALRQSNRTAGPV